MDINRKKKGFTLTEAIFTLIIIGIIAVFAIPQFLAGNQHQKGWDTLAEKMAEYLTQASTEILIYNAVLDDFSKLKLNNEYFSIEDPNVVDKVARLYQNYLSDIDLKIDTSKQYFKNPILDYDRNPVGEKLNEAYSNFFHVNDGMIIGFRTYEGCDKTEKNVNPPKFKRKYELPNICGSIFYDINAYGKPNKLGSDQFIIPFDKRGIKYIEN